MTSINPLFQVQIPAPSPPPPMPTNVTVSETSALEQAVLISILKKHEQDNADAVNSDYSGLGSLPRSGAGIVDLTAPQFWLPLTDWYPVGYAHADAPALDALDHLAWSTSIARELGVKWESYQSIVQTRRSDAAASSNEYSNSGGSYFFSLDPSGRVSSAYISPHMAAHFITNEIEQTERNLGQTIKDALSSSAPPTIDSIRVQLEQMGYSLRREAIGPATNPSTDPNITIVQQPTRWVAVYNGGTGATNAIAGNNWDGSTGLAEHYGWGAQDIADLQEIGLLPPALEQAAMDALLEVAKEELPNSIDNAVLGSAGENAVRAQLVTEGWENLGEQVRVLVSGPNNRLTLRIYDFVVRNPQGGIEFLEVKTNGGFRNDRQLTADQNMLSQGGIVVSNKAGLAGWPFGTIIGPTTVGLVNVTITRTY